MNQTNVRLNYIKNILGIKSIIVPENYVAKVARVEDQPTEFLFQTFNEGSVLFLSTFEGDKDKLFSVDELQLLEKIIVALKLKFEKTDIAKARATSRAQLVSDLKTKKYSYVFLLGEKISNLFKSNMNSQIEVDGLKFFSTFHPHDMIQSPDLKKDAWAGFKSIMESLPR